MAETNATETKVEPEKAKSSAFDCLAVTQVSVWPFKEGPNLGHMKGIAQIVLNDQMVIRGLRVMDGQNGLVMHVLTVYRFVSLQFFHMLYLYNQHRAK